MLKHAREDSPQRFHPDSRIAEDRINCRRLLCELNRDAQDVLVGHQRKVRSQ